MAKYRVTGEVMKTFTVVVEASCEDEAEGKTRELARMDAARWQGSGVELDNDAFVTIDGYRELFE